MKKVYLLLLFVFGFSAFAQQKGISYQAVIINPNAVAAPGYNGTSIPLANKAICLSFKIMNSANQVEYQESQAITTDGYGMVNVVIGTGTSGAGLVSTLEAVAWNQGNKKLVVGVNTDGVCSNYTEISNQVLNYTPYSFYAQNADIKDGYVTTAKLADGAVTDPKVAMGINPAKVGLGNVNNTSDVNKPVSTATQTALDSKANSADVTTSLALKENLSNKSSDIVTDATSTTKYPTVKAIKDYVDANSNSGTGTIVDADTTTKGKIKLAGDLGGTADFPTVPGLALKANLASPTFTGTVSGIDKTMVGLTNVDNTTDADKPVSTATQTALNLKANTADVTTSLALKANLASPNFTGTVSGIDKTMVGLTNVDNTTDADKPVSTATQTALDLKANTTDVTASLALKANLASPTFTGTVSGIDKTMVGLTNVDNTTDADKPVSTATQTALNLKANTADVTASLALKENLSNKSSDIVTDATSTTKYPTVKAIKDYVDIQNAAAGVADGSITTAKITNATIVNEDVAATAAIDFSKLNIQKSDVVGLGLSKVDIGLTNVDNTTDADKPVSTATQTALDLKANTSDVTTSLALKANLASPTFTGTVSGIDKTMVGLTNVDNTTDADKPISTATQTALNLKANTADMTTSLALKANLASPTFTGIVTAPIYASTPQTLIDAATINWNPVNGLNASVTLGGNRTLNFTTTPTAGSYGTLVVIQDGTGGRTLTLPSVTNKILGSSSTTTIGLSSAGNANDIVNFYFDGTNYFWNVGQGYGAASTFTANNIAGGAAGSIPYQTGTGATGFLAKGNDGQILTLASGAPSWAAAPATGVTSVAMTTPTGLTVTGSPITSSGTLALSLSTGYEIPTTTSQTNWDAAYTNRITSATSPLSISSNAISLGTVPVSLGGTGATTFATNNVLLGNGTSALQVVAPGSSGNVLTSNGTTWTSAAAGVPYSGATGAVDLGAYDLTVNGLTVGRGRLAVATNTAIGYASMASNTSTGVNNTGTGYATLSANTTGANNTASGYGALNVNQGGSNNSAYGNRSLLANVSGGMNTSMGSFSLSANTASNNTAFGYGALANNVGGTNNVAQGGNSLSNNTSGSDNTAIGMNGMLMNTTGSYNTTLGSLADINANNLSNSIALGYGARVLASNTIQLGSDGSSLTLGGNTYTTTAISNVRTSGTLTLKDVMYPNSHNNSNGQVLTINGSGVASWATPAASGVPYSGASGAVNLGAYELTSNGVTVGRGASSRTNNYAYGYAVLSANTTGNYNNAFGHQALTANTTGRENNAFGEYVMPKNIDGNYNTAMGSNALKENTSGSGNTGFGKQALQTNSTGSNNTAIGHQANVSVDGLSNATAIGSGATVTASNTIQLGNSAVTNVKTNGTITAKDVTYPNTHNSTAGQVLTVNATGTASWAAPSGGSSSGGHYVGEVYGGGIVFYITPGGYHGLIASSTDIVSNPYAIFDRATSPSYKSTTNSENLYMDWVTPTLSQLNLLYSARATTGLNLGNFFYISTTNGDNDAFSYKGLNFSNNVAGVVNGNWTSNGPEIRGRAIRTF